MSAFDFPLINGVAPSWADVAVRAKPETGPLIELGDIKAINTSYTVEVGLQKEGGRVVNRSRGEQTQDASLTLYGSGFKKLLRGLLASAPTFRGNQALISLVVFGINVQYTPPGSVDILEFRLKGCRYLGRTFNGAEGSDVSEVEVPLSVIQIVDVVDGVETTGI